MLSLRVRGLLAMTLGIFTSTLPRGALGQSCEQTKEVSSCFCYRSFDYCTADPYDEIAMEVLSPPLAPNAAKDPTYTACASTILTGFDLDTNNVVDDVDGASAFMTWAACRDFCASSIHPVDGCDGAATHATLLSCSAGCHLKNNPASSSATASCASSGEV